MQVYRVERPDYWERTKEEVAVALIKEEIQQRFSATEFLEWYEEGYRLYEYCLDNSNVTRGECIVTKDNVAERSEVSYKKIWSD